MSNTVIARMSGLVTFSNGDKQQLAAQLDEHGNISTNSKTESGLSMCAINQEDSTDLTQLFAALGGHVTLNFAGCAAEGRTVTDLVLELSGRVAYADGTKNDFIVQYTAKTGISIPPYFLTSPWADAVLANAAGLKAMFDALMNNTLSTVA